ncbi:hypothetical protein GGI04_001830 [Coemansia thaxteri]|uniref:Uncharacterized protein n=1 Tax=Coemansia thaxteri TaxID=2663907 RepID=A0A9W8BP58_9FUNG|nr:hypothetical protein GGI04_001830 [Coemansia thaxteri]KAJ2007443.1 hypothetical protein H4R26_000768 [Coemansia thaxteri]KAJ2462029.1 hypothetical protein GGI02_005554 [Coemansia sp. RSA 2322]KAJ2486996.1 hypothetical protein EV174_000797 [Coemansia sp. RSA 2320]
MESLITLVDTGALPGAAPASSPAPAASGSDAGAQEMSAASRPSLIRSTAGGFSPSEPHAAAMSTSNEVDRIAVSSRALLLAALNAPVVRSHSEQTTSSNEHASDTKTHAGIVRRLRESLKRRLKSISDSIVLSSLHQSTQGIDDYYSVSLH